MTTVTDAIEAGARALSEHWRDMHTNESLGRQRMLADHAARATWPILSAPLRELHHEDAHGVFEGESAEFCACRDRLPCASLEAIRKTDKELGL